jgi:ABC-type nitrate/sulfonate/bicarbonate transport system permease component
VIIVLAGLGVGLIHAVQMLERRLAQWKETERAVG